MSNSKRNSEAHESKKEVPDEFRCRRNDGKLWRCSLHAMEGRTLCQKHYKRPKLNISRKSTVGRPRIKPIKPSEEKPTTQKPKRANTSERIKPIKPSEEKPTTQKPKRANTSEGPRGKQGPPKRGRKKKQQEKQTNVIKRQSKNEEEEEEETCRTSEKYIDSESGSESECETPPRKKFRIGGNKWDVVRDLDMMRWKPQQHPNSTKKFLPNGLMEIPLDVNGRHDFKKIFEAVESMPKQVEFKLPEYDDGKFIKRNVLLPEKLGILTYQKRRLLTIVPFVVGFVTVKHACGEEAI